VNILELNNVTVTLKNFSLRNITFNLQRGTITGLIGANGSGKTTLIRTIMNLYRHETGSIRLNGLDNIRDAKWFKDKIGFVYDESYFIENLTIERNKNVIRPFYSKWDERLFSTLLEKFALDRGKKVKHLSKGMKTKFSLAVALSHHADLLLMDEPTSGLDPVFRVELLEFIAQYVQDHPHMTVLFSTHITADLDRIANHIVYMRKGKIRLQMPKNDLFDRCTVIRGPRHAIDRLDGLNPIGLRQTGDTFECLVMEPLSAEFGDLEYIRYPRLRLEDIMFYLEREKAE
jgi:ABC-2 type transport system ATP-binding protein